MEKSLQEKQIALKDLSNQEFIEKYEADRFTATVISNRFRYIVSHMCNGLLRTAFSSILRDWYDFAATISGPPELDYPMAVGSDSMPVFMFTMSEAVANTIEELGVENIKPGDVYVANDPYRTGTHVNDVCFIRPVFHGDKLVSFVSIQAHMLDMGGTVPGGFSGTKKDIYENGLVLAGNLLYQNDKPYKPTWKLIFDNTRFGELLISDIKSIYQNLLLGERLLLQTINQYGLPNYLGAIRYACDNSEESMRRAIASIPDGVYEAEELVDSDGIDDSEEYRIKLKVTIKGDKAEVDLSGTSRQMRTSINAGWLDTRTAIGNGFKFLFDPHSPVSSGLFRPIDIVLPEGTFLSALPPEGTILLFWEATVPLMMAVWKAFRNALGENALAGGHGTAAPHNAYGVSAAGIPWLNMCQCGGEHGPWGGTKRGDGDSYNVIELVNSLDPATEAIEMDTPAVILRKQFVADTAGPGQNRGGAAVLKDTLWLTESNHISMPMHFKTPSGFGVNGGRDGKTGGVWLWEGSTADNGKTQKLIGLDKKVYKYATPVAGLVDHDTKAPDSNGEFVSPFSVPVRQTKPNAIYRYITNGAGGWGDPLNRDPEKVKKDVQDEYVSLEGARRDYGVVIIGDPISDPEGLVVDYEATNLLREEMR